MTGNHEPRRFRSVWFALGLLAWLLSFGLISPGSARAQSGDEYRRWVDWCISIGGTPNGDASNPVCTPGVGGGGQACCDPPADPYAYLRPYYTRFNQVLQELQPYSSVARSFTAAVEGDEATFSGLLKSLYDPLFAEYRQIEDAAYLFRQQVTYFNEHMEALRLEVNALETTTEERRQAISKLAALTENLKATLAAEQAISHQLRDRGLALYNDQRSSQQLASLILIYAPSPPLTPAALDERPAATAINGWSDDSRSAMITAPYASDVIARPWPQRVVGGQTSYVLDLSAPLDSNIANLELLKGQLIQAVLDYNHYAPEADRLRASFEPLWNRKTELLYQQSSEQFAVVDTENNVLALNNNISATAANKDVAAKFLAGEMIVALAKDVAVDKMKGAVSDLLDANGLPNDLPTMSSDDLVAAAKSGIRIAIPKYSFQEQWNAFVDIQKQSLDLLNRNQGYFVEAARLCAEASPEQIERLSERVFSDLNWQAADLVRQVGFTNLPEEKSLFEGFIDKFVETYKPQDDEGD